MIKKYNECLKFFKFIRVGKRYAAINPFQNTAPHIKYTYPLFFPLSKIVLEVLFSEFL